MHTGITTFEPLFHRLLNGPDKDSRVNLKDTAMATTASSLYQKRGGERGSATQKTVFQKMAEINAFFR